jgi:hypothetical protein
MGEPVSAGLLEFTPGGVVHCGVQVEGDGPAVACCLGTAVPGLREVFGVADPAPIVSLPPVRNQEGHLLKRRMVPDLLLYAPYVE